MNSPRDLSQMDAGKGPAEICTSLAAAGYSVRFRAYSALDRYLELPELPFLWIETNADIGALAKHIDNLRFPGVEIADAAMDTANGISPNEANNGATHPAGIYPAGTIYFRSIDRDESSTELGPKGQAEWQKDFDFSLPLLSFTYDWKSRYFQDPLGLYPLLKALRCKKEPLIQKNGAADFSWKDAFIPEAQNCGRFRFIMEMSLVLSRYDLLTGIRRCRDELSGLLGDLPSGPLPEPEIQRAFLSCLMISPEPNRGLEFLKITGLLEQLWPELARFDSVDHSKEFHPEGNVWNHTLETFRHRKSAGSGGFDLRLSLGLLLHDAGKPIAAAYGNRRFDGHAELGAREAVKFLERLEFEPSLIDDVYYLVRNHMLPAALKRLPLAKTQEIMASPLFPVLMELYRCDESSSFKGLDGYYENSAAYQAYLKNLRNPYRSADGKILGKGELRRQN